MSDIEHLDWGRATATRRSHLRLIVAAESGARPTTDSYLPASLRSRPSISIHALSCSRAPHRSPQPSRDIVTPGGAGNASSHGYAKHPILIWIRYQTPTALTEPLAQAAMQALLSEPVPATRLPAVPCDLLEPVTGLPAMGQMLPAVPAERLDGFVDLRRSL